MTLQQILKKVRELEIKSKKLTRHLFTGEYHSAFKGRGMLFKEVREYNAGDDIRFIDWNVSARFNHPFSKVFEEERELTLMLIVDISSSTRFGTSDYSKRDLANEIGAVLAFSAISNNDKVGAIFYSDKVEYVVPPKKGRDHVLYMVRELLTAPTAGKGTKLAEALRRFNNSTRQKCITFILSDFLDPGLQDALKVAGKKHDVIGIKIYDRLDMELPDLGLIEVEDPETGVQQLIDSSDVLLRQRYQQEFFRHAEECRAAFLAAGCDLLHVRTDEDYVKVLQKFFKGRNR